MSAAPKEFGHLNDKRWDRKKIDEWAFDSPIPIDPEQLARLGKPVAHVALIRVRSRPKPDSFKFSAASKWFKDITASTYGELMAKVELAFRDAQLAATSIKWSDWLEVRVSGNDQLFDEANGAKSGEIRIAYTTVKRGVFPDGRDMLLEPRSWNMVEFPKPKARGVENDGWRHQGKYPQSEDAQYAYIPATPENISALDAMIASIEYARANVEALLAQSAIIKTLASVPSVPLLGAPK